VPFPGEDHCYCKFGESGHHDMCRTHAEQRAITLAREGDGWRMLPGSKLIYVRLEADDSVRLEKPHFCPRCSRLALSLGVAEWIFALSEGLVRYSCADYDTISQLGWLPTPPGLPSTRHTGPTMTIKPDLLTTTRAIAAVMRGCGIESRHPDEGPDWAVCAPATRRRERDADLPRWPFRQTRQAIGVDLTWMR